nr:glycosyltransferase family 2 protein [Mucilaginibacter sp. L294]
MKISIITVAYNSAKTIEETIRSVLSQDYGDIEYLIIDGKSTDGTLDIINKYKAEISNVISEADEGIYDAMNKGIKVATGDIIGFLNSDDVFENESVLSIIADQFLKKTDTYVVYGDLNYVLQDDLTKVKRRWISMPYYQKFFDDGHVPPHPTLYAKKKVYEIVGHFNTNYKLAADYEFMLRLFKKHNFNSVYIALALVKMRLGGATNKNVSNIIKGNKEILNSWTANNLSLPLTLMPKRVYRRLIQFI